MQAENSPWVKIFSARLRQKLKGRKRTDIAKELGITSGNLSMYCAQGKDRRLPGLENFRALCVLLGVKSDWLLGLSDTPTPGASPVVTAIGGSAASGTGNATVNTAPASPAVSPAETDRLLSLIESQQRVIENLSERK